MPRRLSRRTSRSVLRHVVDDQHRGVGRFAHGAARRAPMLRGVKSWCSGAPGRCVGKPAGSRPEARAGRRQRSRGNGQDQGSSRRRGAREYMSEYMPGCRRVRAGKPRYAGPQGRQAAQPAADPPAGTPGARRARGIDRYELGGRKSDIHLPVLRSPAANADRDGARRVNRYSASNSRQDIAAMNAGSSVPPQAGCRHPADRIATCPRSRAWPTWSTTSPLATNFRSRCSSP